MTTIYIQMPDGEQRVLPEDEVRTMLLRKQLTQDTLFWREGMAAWEPLHELPPRFVTGHAGSAATGKSSTATQPVAALRARQKSPQEKITYNPIPKESRIKLWLMRLMAVVIDNVLLFGPIIFVATIGRYVLEHDEKGVHPDRAFYLLSLVYFLFIIPGQIIMIFRARSWGKNIFSLRVVEPESDAYCGFFSDLIRFVTHGFFGIAPLVLWSYCIWPHQPPEVLMGATIYGVIDALPIFINGRCLHDYFAGTTVIQRDFH